ncbi:plant invertase/pectin methylesterase inhibitor superfamily [Dorcoceras hygrometricum]|uniref:Pectinesterase n=1 Tax=Dorcoceras hygrometricum TaxID=472368 RepID=A0A2Z7AY60_9LAMI|nr:plant invertase/pectin methylesterase inhibitor superfamily [Dorcoceras hygrometricum]
MSCFMTISYAAKDDFEQDMRIQCGFTRYPTLCVQTLTGLASGNQKLDFTAALVNMTIRESQIPDSGPADESIPSLISTQTDRLAQSTIDNCHELMKMSLKRLNQALEALQISPKRHKPDIQTWISAAITYQQSCKDDINGHTESNPLMEKISRKIDYLSELSSNSLALANRIPENLETQKTATNSRRLLHQNEIFPEWVSASDRKLLQSTQIKANAVVAKDGSGNYKTISEAVQAAGGGRFVIYVKAGTYSEKVHVNKNGITLIGDGKYSTIITASSNVAGGSSLQGSATFTITGDGFIARDIGFQNTAGPLGHQAVALLVASDRSVIYRCSIAGYQDTLFAYSLRQFYRECDIYGTVDFIFGDAAAVFQSCTLILRRPRQGGAFVTVMANGRTDPGQNTGFSVQNCKITVGSDFAPVKNSYRSYLGRPWKEYSRAVVMETYIDAEIDPRGWVEWEGAGSSTYRTLYYAEYANTGPGSSTSGRVNWPGFHVIGTPEASKFTVANFIGGNSWLPSTGVDFTSGL